MPILHSFLKVYSLRTGAAASLVMSLVFLVIFLVLGFVNNIFMTKTAEHSLQWHIIFLYLFWFFATTLGFYGVYTEQSTYLVPELSRRVLFIILDIMGFIAKVYATDYHMVLPDVGLQWYTVASADNVMTYYILLVFFILTIPIKVYFFIIMLSYGLLIRKHEGYDASPAAASASSEDLS